MSERIARPPVRLAGGLPDGNLTNLGAHAADLLSDAPAELYALVRLTRQQLIHQDDQDGAEIAVLKVRALEVLPDQAAARQQLTETRAERTGDNPIDFDAASDADYAKLADLRGHLAAYAAEEGLTDTSLGEEVLATVPAAGAGWRDQPLILEEFLRVKGVIADPPAGGDTSGSEDDGA